MKRVLYIGGFEMPDKNAAAQRVLSVAKALRECDCEVSFYGITKSGDIKGTVDGFEYEAMSYPSSTKSWACYALGNGIVAYLDKKRPDIIIAYNYPAIAQEKVIRYAHKNGIKVVGDITEWYQADRFVKQADTSIRMRYSNKHLDGIIPISRYLADYYKKGNILYLPPLVDKREEKWLPIDQTTREEDCTKLIYVGSPSAGKDRLDYIINGILSFGPDKFHLDIVGIDETQYKAIYEEDFVGKREIVFHGRLPHKEAVILLKHSDFQIFFRERTRVNNAGFPTKFVESISAGVPVITNRISNISDYILNGVNSFMVEDITEETIHEVLCKAARLTRDEIEGIKKSIDSNLYDYRNYIEQVNNFIRNI